MEANIGANNNRNVKISAMAFAAKYKSKKEIYYLLTVDANAFLPSYETITIYYLKDIISGKCKCKFY